MFSWFKKSFSREIKQGGSTYIITAKNDGQSRVLKSGAREISIHYMFDIARQCRDNEPYDVFVYNSKLENIAFIDNKVIFSYCLMDSDTKAPNITRVVHVLHRNTVAKNALLHNQKVGNLYCIAVKIPDKYGRMLEDLVYCMY